ncbi:MULTISPECIES: DUF3899 domain-containing protein [Enterococcus]|uniref:DUF3899 domain-containing protein n=1 Tax=Enterococcus TaxID=1350 RepID=UPI001E3C4E43|nr:MULTISPECIES: DUF3899 domain-containing protein [Enterococcus]
MKKLRYPLIVSALCVIGSIIIALIKNTLSLSTMSDYLFMFTLFFLIIGGFLSVFASGFFDFFQHSIRKSVARKEKRDLPYTKFSEVGAKNYRFWLLTTGILFILSLIFLLTSFI